MFVDFLRMTHMWTRICMQSHSFAYKLLADIKYGRNYASAPPSLLFTLLRVQPQKRLDPLFLNAYSNHYNYSGWLIVLLSTIDYSLVHLWIKLYSDKQGRS